MCAEKSVVARGRGRESGPGAKPRAASWAVGCPEPIDVMAAGSARLRELGIELLETAKEMLVLADEIDRVQAVPPSPPPLQVQRATGCPQRKGAQGSRLAATPAAGRKLHGLLVAPPTRKSSRKRTKWGHGDHRVLY